MTRFRTFVVALGLVACGSNPEDIFSYKGRVLSGAGEPVPDASVVLRWTPELVGAPTSFCFGSTFDRNGMMQATPKKPRATPLTTVATDTKGAFVAEVFRAQLEYQTAAACLRVETETGADAKSWVDFFWQGTQHGTTPDLQPWRHEAKAVRGDGGWAVTTRGLELAADASVDSVSLVGSLRTGDGGLAWAVAATSDDGGSPVLWVEDGALEDFEVTTTLDVLQSSSTESLGGGPFGGGRGRVGLPPVGATQRNAVTLPRGAAAASRGATCDGFVGVCPLTDGALASTSLDGGVLRFHLAAPAVVRSVVLRGVATASGVPVVAVRLRDVASGAQVFGQSGFDPNSAELPAASPFLRFELLGPLRGPDAGWKDVELDFPAGAPDSVSEVSFFE